MALTPLDAQRLCEALEIAQEAIGRSDPNPRVGCVIGLSDGRVLGRGATQQVGGWHAEVMALRDAASAGAAVRGATAWVSLEPCSHHGRTPPCCEALIQAGIARVVAAIGDPNPQVAGAGLARLRAAGIEVELADELLARQARDLNIGFFSRHERHRPWVRLKVAASIDGRTALGDGTSQWLTGAAARADTHAWRKRAGAVLSGIGTVLHDDPRLDVRLVATELQPLRVIVDSRLRLPARAKVLQPPGHVLVATTDEQSPQALALRELGAEVRSFSGADGRVDLGALLHELTQRDVNELHVEAGATLNGAWLRSGFVDELLLYVAPLLVGPGSGVADGPPLQTLAEASRFELQDCQAVGPDLRLRYFATGPRGLPPRRKH